MSNSPISRTRRWIGASALAVMVAAGGATGLALTSNQAAAQINVPGPAPTSVPASFADLVQAVKPAVVSIDVDGVETVNSGPSDGYQFNFPDLPPDHPFRRFFDQFGDQFGAPGQNRQPQQRHFQAAGSGFIISADGYVVTNNHVVENADKVTVVDDQGNNHSAKVVGTDPRTDVALLKIDGAKDLPFVEFANDEVRVGDWVVAVGNPFGLGGTVTAGIVSARGRDISAQSYGDYIQIDAAVNRGNSGGPAFDLNGKVVGMNTAIFSPNGGNVGIAFAIPAKTVKEIVNDLKTNGVVTRGFLGVSIQDLTPDIADSVGLDNSHGAVVTEPTSGSPAANAGIQSGDVILSVDGQEISNAKDLSRNIAEKEPGTKVTVEVWRDGAKKSFDVTLGKLDEQKIASNDNQQQQPEQPAEPQPSSVGLVLVPNSGGDGLLVQDIQQDSAAADKGFAVGDVILEANNEKVSSLQDFEKAVSDVKAAGRGTLLVKASRDGAVRFIGVPLNIAKAQ